MFFIHQQVMKITRDDMNQSHPIGADQHIHQHLIGHIFKIVTLRFPVFKDINSELESVNSYDLIVEQNERNVSAERRAPLARGCTWEAPELLL